MDYQEWQVDVWDKSIEVTRWPLDDGGVCVVLECGEREVTLIAPEDGAWCYVVREVDGQTVGSELIERQVSTLDFTPLTMWVASVDVLRKEGE